MLILNVLQLVASHNNTIYLQYVLLVFTKNNFFFLNIINIFVFINYFNSKLTEIFGDRLLTLSKICINKLLYR